WSYGPPPCDSQVVQLWPDESDGRRRHWAILAGCAALVFLSLAIAGRLGVSTLESQVFTLCRASGAPRSALHWLDHLRDPVGLIPLGLVLWAATRRHHRIRGRDWFVALVATGVAEQVAKYVVARPRPFGHEFGFPSGHAALAAAFGLIAAHLVRR